MQTHLYGEFMKRINTYIREEQIKKLQEIKNKEGILPAEIIRRALDEWFKKHDKK